jgi:hypothetical protein
VYGLITGHARVSLVHVPSTAGPSISSTFGGRSHRPGTVDCLDSQLLPEPSIVYVPVIPGDLWPCEYSWTAMHIEENLMKSAHGM